MGSIPWPQHNATNSAVHLTFFEEEKFMEQRCIVLRRLGRRLGTFGIANPGIMKVTVVGAGNVGATCANVLATREVANEVVLLDIKDGFAEGKALDIWETAPINLYDTRTVGSTNDYSKTAGSEVVVITSGLPRKPGMSQIGRAHV